MANYNVDLAQLDEGATGAPRVSTAKNTTPVSQAEIDAAVRQAGLDLGVDPTTLAYEAGLSGTTVKLNTLSAAELAAYQEGRADKITQARKFGTEDNPQPYDPPAGTHWNNYNGTWYLYNKDNIRIGDENGYDKTKVTGSSSFEVPGLAAPGSKIFQFLGGKMYYDGVAFTGEQDNAKWVNGVKTAVASGKDEDGNIIWKSVDSGGATGAPTGAPTGSPTGSPVPVPTITAADQAKQVNAIAALTATFNAMGLGSEIADAITDMVQRGYTTDTIMLIAQDPNSKDPVALAFQKRFAGNAARIKAGLAPLAPAEYMATERAYRQTMEAAGLPKGFYDSPDDYTKFIANDVSPTELKARVDTAADAIANADPFYVNSLKSMYGLTTGDMIAHALDPQMALPLLQKQQAAAKIGSAAAREGWGISATGAENLYTQGVSQAQAEQGFRTVAGMQTAQQKLAQIWGGDAAAQGQNLVASTFGTAGAAYADQQIKALQQKEIGSFSGGSGASKGSLGIGVEQTGGGL